MRSSDGNASVTRRDVLAGIGAVGLGIAGGAVLSTEAQASPEGKMDEVRYEMLLPGQMIARRKACPVAYLPIGTLEWHDLGNALGLDALKAQGLAVECARKGGGVVFPPLYYGECRTEAHMDMRVADGYQVSAENMGPDAIPYSTQEQYDHYHVLLIHMLHQIASLGFKFIIVSAGHAPLMDHARSAMAVFRQTAKRRPYQPTTGWVFTGYELVKDKIPEAGDHAGPWETSLMMALFPGSVDLSLMPEKVRAASSVEYGRKAIEAVVDRVLERVNDMIADPKKYLGHYTPM